MKRLYVKTTGEEAATAIAAAQKVFQSFEPNSIFNYTFVDEAYDELYKTEARSSTLLALFAALAILISCLGILGLAAYTAERRRKEIGIRKVLGASISNIVTLLSKEFLVLVILALFLAVPIGWYFMQDWLEGFAYRINIGWGVFVLAGVVAIIIAFLTVSIQSLKAALANPVQSIRQE
jgi:putative ABC transport system permease protein